MSKQQFIIALALLIFWSFAQAADRDTRNGLIMETVYMTLHVIDYGQTLDMTNHKHITETNPILGANPTPRQVHSYFIATALVHMYVSATLPPLWRHVWQVATSTVQVSFVSNNAQLGLRVRF